MRFEQLEYLIELSRRKSLNAAAEKLHISQQALSLAVRNLEEELGVKLLDRNYQGIKLTVDGIEAVKRAKDIVERAEEMKQVFRPGEQNKRLKGTLEILASYIAITTFLGDFIALFRKKHPMVRIAVQEYDVPQIVRMLTDTPKGSQVLGLVDSHMFKEVDLSSREVSYQPLMTDKLLACVSRYSPLADLKQVSIKNLLKYPFVCYHTIDLSKVLGKDKKIEIALTTSNSFLYMQAIIDNLGIGLMPARALNNVPYFQRLHEETVLIPIKEPFSVEVGYLLPSGAGDAVLVTAFLDELKHYLG